MSSFDDWARDTARKLLFLILPISATVRRYVAMHPIGVKLSLYMEADGLCSGPCSGPERGRAVTSRR
jgi:hypothetical protein